MTLDVVTLVTVPRVLEKNMHQMQSLLECVMWVQSWGARCRQVHTPADILPGSLSHIPNESNRFVFLCFTLSHSPQFLLRVF